MANSQLSYDTLYGRFVDGNTFIQALPDFNPNNELIKKSNMTTFIMSVIPVDKAVNLSLKAYLDETNSRRPLVFKAKDCDLNCLENLIRNIRSYIGAEFGKSNGAYKIISGLVAKFAPQYKKKDPNAPPDARKTPSPSEKSFDAMNSYGQKVLDIITDLGTAYTPQNTYIQPANFEVFLKDLVIRAKKIAKVLSDYSEAASIRNPYYHGPEGILERERLIKDYLASFPGGKKSQNYIQYDRLLKGK